MRLLSCLFCLFTLAAYGQNTKYYSEGKSNPEALRGLIKERGYQALSEFDTVSIDPVLIYAIYFKNNKMGLLDHTGKEITPAIYHGFPGLQKTYGRIQDGYHKHVSVIREGKYGMINLQGKEIVPAKFLYISYVQSVDEKSGRYVDDYYLAQTSDEDRIIITTLGEIGKIPEVEYDEVYDDIVDIDVYERLEDPLERSGKPYPDYGQVWHSTYHPYIVYRNPGLDKCGLMNVETGDTLIPFIYDRMSVNYTHDVQLNIWDSTSGQGRNRRVIKQRQGMADINGRILFEPVYQSVSRFNDVYQVVNMEGKMALFSKGLIPLGGFIYGPKMGSGNGTYMVLQKGEKWGLVNMKGMAVTTFDYDGFSFPEDHDLPARIIIAEKDGKLAVMDFSTAKVLTPFTYTLILPECNVESGGYGAVHEAFNFISNRRNRYYFVATGSVKDSWTPGSTKYGIMDTNFVERIPCQFDGIIKCEDRSLVIVKKDDLWGILNLNTKDFLVPLSLTRQPEEVNYRYFLYPKEGKYGMIDYSGNVVIPFMEEKPFKQEYYYAGLTRVYRYDGYAAFYDGMGNKVEISE
ncbi:MAG TPA: hypothetical protein DIW47_09610 [Bacteroidetes bacterium]|nr:hypothetical protein [Bacteroidota bacterium]